MHKNHIPTLFPLLGIIAGILFSQWMLPNCFDFKWWVVSGSSILFLCILFRTVPLLYSTSFYLTFILLGASSFHLNIDINKHSHFSKFSESDSLLVTVLQRSPTTNGTRLTVKVLSQRSKHESLPASGKLTLYVKSKVEIPLYHNYLIPANFTPVEEYRNPKTFNYAAYLRALNIFHSSYLRADELVPINSLPSLKRHLVSLQTWLSSFFENNINDENYAALVNALIIGQKQNLSSETTKLFRENGLAHLLAISGMHVGIVLIMLMFCLSFIRNIFLKTLLIIIGIWFYILLSGAQIPALRAGFMLSVYLIGKLGRFNSKPLNSVFFSAMVLLCLDPNLLFQLSFQLSFAAMISIMLFYKPIAELVNLQSKLLSKLWQLVALNFSVQILILPITIYYFHQVPTYLMLNSLISIPFIFVIMWLGLLAIGFSFTEQIDFYIFRILEWSIKVYTDLLHVLGELPLALISEIEMSTITLCMWLSAMIGFYYYFFGRKRQISKIFWCFIPVIFFSSFQRIEKLDAQYLTIYDTPKELVFDVTKGSKIDRFTEKPNSQGYQFYVKETGHERFNVVNVGENLILGNDFGVAILGPEEASDQDIQANICVLTSENYQHQNIDLCTKFIIPRKLNKVVEAKIKSWLTLHKKQFVSIRETGAFHLKIN